MITRYNSDVTEKEALTRLFNAIWNSDEAMNQTYNQWKKSGVSHDLAIDKALETNKDLNYALKVAWDVIHSSDYVG